MPCTACVKSSSEPPFILFHGSQRAIAACVWIPTASSGFARGFACDDDESYSMLIGMQLPAASCWPATPEGLSCGLLNRVESSWLWIALLLASSEGWTRSARASNCSAPRAYTDSRLGALCYMIGTQLMYGSSGWNARSLDALPSLIKSKDSVYLLYWRAYVI